jgi:hypothetical protein
MSDGETTRPELEASARPKEKPGIVSCEAMPGFFFGSINLSQTLA